jgi:glycosyltransferase involved in cell wall biosynthesis
VSKRRDRVVLIGPYDAADRFIGGAPVSFRSLVEFTGRTGVSCATIDTRRFSGRLHAPLNLAWTLACAALQIPRTSVVMLNASRRGLIYLGPLLYGLCRLCRARFCVRPFGADLPRIVARLSPLHRLVLRRTLFRAAVLFLETRNLMERYQGVALETAWYPNARPRAIPIREPRAYRKRFVFMAHISEGKGAGVLLDAMTQLDESFTVEFYGPVTSDALARRLRERGCYRGCIPHRTVLETLRSYDVLVLPTFSEHEGYPGAIVEAYSLGMPVVTTRWKSIPEMVTDGESGLLVAPNSAEELAAAMKSIDQASFERMCAGALRQFDAFDGDRVHRHVLDALLP